MTTYDYDGTTTTPAPADVAGLLLLAAYNAGDCAGIAAICRTEVLTEVLAWAQREQNRDAYQVCYGELVRRGEILPPPLGPDPDGSPESEKSRASGPEDTRPGPEGSRGPLRIHFLTCGHTVWTAWPPGGGINYCLTCRSYAPAEYHLDVTAVHGDGFPG